MAQTTATDGGADLPDPDDSHAAFERARKAMGDLLGHVMDEEGIDAFTELQRTYFDLWAGERARDPDFQAVDMDGTRLNVPHVPRPMDEPTVTDEHGEWEAPTRQHSFDGEPATFRVLDGLQVCYPENPTRTVAVTVDHVVSQDGEVTCEVNGTPLAEVGERAGSHIK